MNAFIIGSAIRQKREKMGLTQAELAEKIGVTDKAVSKWETGNGIPDIHIAKLIAEVFDVSVTEILDGDYITNKNQSGNLNKVNFYVCPVCGNIAYSVGEMYASCHGIKLSPLKRENDENMSISQSDGELLIKIDSEMSKENYVSFVALQFADEIHFKKLYPEMSAQARFPYRRRGTVYCYHNKLGLFCRKL